MKPVSALVWTATDGPACAAVRTQRFLEEGVPVTLVVGSGGRAWETVAMLARLKLVARRTGAGLDVVLDDEDVRDLVALAGLSDLLAE